MKKLICLALVGLLGISTLVADTYWHFTSGSREVNYKSFFTVEVRNYTGCYIKADGVVIYNNSSWTFHNSSIMIISSYFDADKFKCYYSISGVKLIVELYKEK